MKSGKKRMVIRNIKLTVVIVTLLIVSSCDSKDEFDGECREDAFMKISIMDDSMLPFLINGNENLLSQIDQYQEVVHYHKFINKKKQFLQDFMVSLNEECGGYRTDEIMRYNAPCERKKVQNFFSKKANKAAFMSFLQDYISFVDANQEKNIFNNWQISFDEFEKGNYRNIAAYTYEILSSGQINLMQAENILTKLYLFILLNEQNYYSKYTIAA